MVFTFALIALAALLGLFYFTDTVIGKKCGLYIKEVVPRPFLRFCFAYFMGWAAILNPYGGIIWTPFEHLCNVIGVKNELIAYSIILFVLSIFYAKAGKNKEKDQ
jgi:hypothetical protein